MLLKLLKVEEKYVLFESSLGDLKSPCFESPSGDFKLSTEARAHSLGLRDRKGFLTLHYVQN